MAEEGPEVGGMPQRMSPNTGVLEVGGVPPGMEELLVLYLESQRRSGGGPVQSCQRLGTLLFLTFERTQDAQNILARGTHRLGGVELCVRPAHPWDPSRLLLGSLDPQTPPELLEPVLESLLGRPRGTFTLGQGPAPGWRLLHLRDPLTPQELAAAEERLWQWEPAGAPLALQRLPQSPTVLVRAEVPGLSPELLELYFENRRSGGSVGSVRAVRLLPGARAATVTFCGTDVAEQVLERSHRLQDMVLTVEPHYPFLESLEREETPTQDKTPTPDTGPSPDKSSVPFTATPMGTVPPAPARLKLAQPVVSSLVPGEVPAALPAGDREREQDEAVAGWRQRQEQAVPLLALVQEEVLVPAEPGAVRYLQQHYQELLGSIPEVSLVPLEGEDVTGFRVSGEPGCCQAAAEFLQSLLGSVGSQAVTLRFPGVARFLRDEGGQSILRQLESRFQCIIDLEGVCWSPPDPQLELAELLPLSCHREPRRQHLPGDANGADDGDNVAAAGDSEGLSSNIEEIKELLAALRPGDATGDEEPVLWPGAEQHPEAELLTTYAGDGARELLWGDVGTRTEEEEEAEMVLAIQRSMESTWHEEEELARATTLSLRSYHREQQAVPSRQEEEDEEEDADLLAALEASLEEALPAADMARVSVFCSFEQDASVVPQALEQALAERLRVEEVASERLRALPGSCRRCLTFLQHRHAVSLSLGPGTATLRGFAEYTTAATRDLTALLQRLPEPGHRGANSSTGTTATCWVRWDPSGTAIPYPAEATALLEQAWQRGERRVDLLLAGRPFTIDLERLEEYDLGSATAVTISRSQPPAESVQRLLGPEALGLEEEVRLMPLAEDSEEFGDTVHHFYQTLEDSHGSIGIIKVQKLIHPLLYQQYRLKKASVEKGCAGGAVPVERVLFHGTTESSSREICLHGFNRSFCGKNAALYGLGVYFAVPAALSVRDRYSPPSADGTKYIFMAKVLTGQYTVGRPGLRAPPLRDGAGVPPRRYDSVVDTPRDPSIFVIFNDTQAYPQYLITCRRHNRGTPDPPGTPCPAAPALPGGSSGGH